MVDKAAAQPLRQYVLVPRAMSFSPGKVEVIEKAVDICLHEPGRGRLLAQYLAARVERIRTSACGPKPIGVGSSQGFRHRLPGLQVKSLPRSVDHRRH